jgi:predicted enzyme related to lactoylglutathione lyase
MKSVDLKLEIFVIPVSDVERAKQFYAKLGWRLDADFAGADNDFRVLQFTPPGSACSVIFGKNVTAAMPGSAQGLYLTVSDIVAAATNCSAAPSRSVRFSTMPPASTPVRTSLTCLDGGGPVV